MLTIPLQLLQWVECWVESACLFWVFECACVTVWVGVCMCVCVRVCVFFRETEGGLQERCFYKVSAALLTVREPKTISVNSVTDTARVKQRSSRGRKRERLLHRSFTVKFQQSISAPSKHWTRLGLSHASRAPRFGLQAQDKVQILSSVIAWASFSKTYTQIKKKDALSRANLCLFHRNAEWCGRYVSRGGCFEEVSLNQF